MVAKARTPDYIPRTVRLPAEMWDWLDDMSRDYHRTPVDQLRHVLDWAIQNYEGEEVVRKHPDSNGRSSIPNTIYPATQTGPWTSPNQR